MSKQGRSDPGMFGSYNHYQKDGKKVGHSDPNLFGGYTNYDANGKKIGHSDPNLFGGYTTYDANGKKVGHSEPNLFGGYTNYDKNGKRVGSSDPGLLGGYSHNDGCYIATCVYGSYDCPEVWTLRRFRDTVLRRHLLGRGFVRAYYAVSPTFVKWFGKSRWFQRFWQGILNRLVRHLNTRGVTNAPYRDL